MKTVDRLRADLRVESVYKDPPDGWWMSLKTGYAFDPAEVPYAGQHTTSELRMSELVRWLRQIKPCNCASCQGIPTE